MGTTISLLLPSHAVAVGVILARSLFSTWEAQLSRFKVDSDLMKLNRCAGRPVPAGELLYAVVDRALEAARMTNGVFDPGMLTQLAALGYDRSFEHLSTDQEPDAAPAPGGGWRHILLDPERREILIPEGVAIDLGGIAKGLAVDATIAGLRRLGIASALVNAGGDLAVLGAPPQGGAWPVAVPLGRRSVTIQLFSGAAATSGRATRSWHQGTRSRHHLLDPRSGESTATTMWSATVVAGDCGQAEVAAKAAFILGPDQGVEFLEHHGLAGLLVDESGEWWCAGPWPSMPLWGDEK